MPYQVKKEPALHTRKHSYPPAKHEPTPQQQTTKSAANQLKSKSNIQSATLNKQTLLYCMHAQTQIEKDT
jgi:hypothetical protein